MSSWIHLELLSESDIQLKDITAPHFPHKYPIIYGQYLNWSMIHFYPVSKLHKCMHAFSLQIIHYFQEAIYVLCWYKMVSVTIALYYVVIYNSHVPMPSSLLAHLGAPLYVAMGNFFRLKSREKLSLYFCQTCYAVHPKSYF